MQIIKGFVSINTFINNTPNLNSLLGELSTWSSSYSREKGEYTTPEIPGLKLITFKSISTDTLEKIVVDPLQVVEILSIVKAAIDYNHVPTERIRPLNTLDFLNTLVNKFEGTIYYFNMGKLVDNGMAELPEWMSWVNKLTNNEIKIWLSDTAFAEQYDDYEIEIIPPVEPLDGMFDSYLNVVGKLKDRTLSELSDVITTKKGIYPDTYMRILSFTYHSVISKKQTFECTWVALVYGKSGDQIDHIKDAIVDYVLKNSTHTREEWASILPDVFKRTEFILLPRWDMISIPNLSDISGLYSSILDPVECISFAKRFTPFYIPAHTVNNINVMPHDFKAISMVVVNGIDNVEGKQLLPKVFGDYIPVSTSTLDFNRMSQYTKDWLMILDQMFVVAEKATAYSGTPPLLRKTVRNGIVFIVAMYDNVNYLMATRASIVGSDIPPVVSQVMPPFIRVPSNNTIDLGPTITFTSSEFRIADNNADVHTDSEWQLSTSPIFDSVVASVISPESKTTWLRTGLMANSDYYVRVRYNGSKYGWSAWSDIVKFTTKVTYITELPPEGDGITIGTFMDGGYYAGIINDSGHSYRIIVAPRNGGQSETALLFMDPALGPDTTIASRSSYVHGYKATTDMIDANEAYTYLLDDIYVYPVAQFIQGMIESNFNGYNDWYVPARDELEIIYRAFKPTNANNTIGKRIDGVDNGTNANAFINQDAYVNLIPAQTTVDKFLDPTKEGMGSTYWSATAYSDTEQWTQAFASGSQQVTIGTSFKQYVRAIRRIKIS